MTTEQLIKEKFPNSMLKSMDEYEMTILEELIEEIRSDSYSEGYSEGYSQCERSGYEDGVNDIQLED